jgi:hypothetical protein
MCAGTSARGQGIPFVLPWNDSTRGVTDFSAMNAPIGTNRVGVDSNGHFTVNGGRIRFLGVNFAADSPFAPTNNAEAMAARVAKFGINVIRFHHMDAQWAYNGGLLNYTANTTTNFNAGNLERLHYLVSRLKAHGVYADINLLVGRDYGVADGLGPEENGMDWKLKHILGYFYDPALALHKDYALKLLTPTNRFTGLPLAKDPGVAFVEVINENGIIQKWTENALDILPTRYATNLQARWNNWLTARYTNQSTMLAAWNTIDQPLGTNLLINGAFSNALASWSTEQHGVALATFTRTYDFTNGQPSAKIQVTNPDTVAWYIQFNQPNLRLTSNQVYTISCWAKSSPVTNADVAVMRAHDDYVTLGYYQGLSLTTNWQQFTASFQASATETNARVNFGSMGNELATFWYADVRLQSGGQIGTLPPGTSLASGTVPNLIHAGSGYVGTQEARRDWLRFLRDLEYAYYDTMVAFIRTNCGYSGLIFGTIMANSPATVQTRMDSIDGHAYWQHPQFPGVAWDPNNWFQPNISMVNTVGDDNTLAGLARQRIHGKPFTVTEYEHPSPNYHGAESPLLLAAYAGLQDWDGLWLFAYGPGNDMAPMGYVGSYFEISQHPTKMANLLLAANLFRRQDVQPAVQEYTMALTPEHELDLLQNSGAWNIFSSSQMGVPGKLAFTSRLSTDVGANPSGLTTPPAAPTGNILTSDTGELRWDTSVANQGLVTINTPHTKALIGTADNQPVALGDVTLRPGTTRLGWCTLGATLVDGTSFTSNCTAIIVASGWWENTGQVWTDGTKTSVGTQWGHAPVLTETVPFTLTLPVSSSRVRVWSLDERGQRKSVLPVSGTSSSTTLTVDTNAATIWYELQVDPITSFNSWRTRYFTPTELADPVVSGPAAKPDSDAMPNLWKYYAGLPGRTLMSAWMQPQIYMYPYSGDLYLGAIYYHSKQVTDVTLTPQTSADLASWASDPLYSEVKDLGSMEQVIVTEWTPISAYPKHFLRLRLDLY